MTTNAAQEELLLLGAKGNFDHALFTLYRALIQSSTLEEISALVLSYVKTFTASSLGFVGYIDQDSANLIVPAIVLDVCSQGQVLGRPAVLNELCRLGEFVLQNGGRVLANDVESSSCAHAARQEKAVISRFLGVAAMCDRTVFGVVGAANRAEPFNEQDLEVIQRLADIYALAVERYWAVQKRQEQQSFLQVLLNSIPNPVFYKNLAGVYLGGNTAFARFIGRDLQDIAGKTAFDIAPPHLAQIYTEQDEDLRNKGGIQIYEAKVRYADGSDHDVVFNKSLFAFPDGGVGGIVGIIVDITERKKAEEELRRQKNILDSVVSAVPHYIYWKDRQLRYVGCNRRFAELSDGKSAQELIGQTDAVLSWAEEGLVFHRHCDETVLKGGVPLLNVEEQIIDASGTRRVLLTSRSPLVSEHGEIIGVLGVSADITEMRRREQSQRELEKRMRQAQRLESMEVLAGGVAHDFNNLLGVIIGNVGMLLEGPMEYIESRPYLEQIDRVAQRAAAIAEQMLAYSGSGNIAQEPIDLAEVIRQMRPFIQTIVSKKAKVEYALDCPVPPVIGDAAQLRQVLINLLLNASEALNGKPGIIGVEAGVKRCRADDFSCLACGDSLPEGEYVVITVRDTGCGMDSDTAAKIFDPFFSTKFIGRGLGLAAVLGIVRGHNGGIAVSSHPDQGAQFLVYLPVNRLADEMPRDISVCCGAPLARQTVMIVDDEELLLAMAERIMRRAGFRVLKAGDGRAAVEVFRAYREEISVVILDLMMPELSGEETMLELRRLDPRVRILFSSGYSEHAISPEIINSALTGFIKKPYRPVQLLAAVERLRKEEIRE